MFGFACKACGNGDKTTDTVKVSFPQANAEDKENAVPELSAGQLDKIEAERQLKLEQEAQERRRREEAERLEREEAERLEREEAQRILREQEERDQRLALELQRAEEEERQRRELEAQQAREAEEQRRKQEEARRRIEEAKNRKQLGQFLASNGFQGATEKKKTRGLLSSGFTYPLHAAVRAADAKAVGLLVLAGADRSMQDSAKLTPLELAQKLDKKGSHKLVIDALSA